MTDNPYKAPVADVRSLVGTSGQTRLYSPTQVACATIGGPVGLIYFLKANFASLGNDQLERKTVLYGGAFILALLIILPLLPDKFPSSPFTVGYIVTGRHVASRYQMTKQAIAESPDYDFHSNWRVLGLGLLCLLASVVVIMGPLIVLAMLGIWNP